MPQDDLQTVLKRINQEIHTEEDLEVLAKAVQSGQVQIAQATGKESVGIGGSADESVIMTGDGNIVLNVPDPKQLLQILAQFQPTISAPPAKALSPASPGFAEVHNFDLTSLVDECMEELLVQQGLIGFAIPYKDDTFLVSLCQRIRNKLNRKRTDVRGLLSLKPRITSLKTFVQKIKTCQKTLKSMDVIQPIRIEIRNGDSTIVNEFWQQLQEAFPQDLTHRLIVVMVGDETCMFPDEAIPLEPPEFTISHANSWIQDIVEILNWEDIRNQWFEKMTVFCSYDPIELKKSKQLDIELVYYHLDKTQKLLQHNPSLTAEAFLEQLELD